MVSPGPARRLPVGAEPVAGGGVHFRVWAPKRRRVDLVLERGRTVSMSAQEGGYFACHLPDAAPGTRYRFQLDDAGLFPDPASRFQPEGPHGPSQVVAPDAYDWHDAAWAGVKLPDTVLYEMHVGTFTGDGTWRAAERELPRLRDIGITCLEMMPVADFPGRFGWGYDGVDLFAPTRLYGTPEDLRSFVDRAHALERADPHTRGAMECPPARFRNVAQCKVDSLSYVVRVARIESRLAGEFVTQARHRVATTSDAAIVVIAYQ